MRQIELTKGHVAIVDDEDYERLMQGGSWCAAEQRDGTYVYAVRAIKRGSTWTTQRMHSFLTGWPYVDHANGNALDNRRANLRPANQTQNNANQRRNKTNTSGFRGVTWHRGAAKWVAQIHVHKKNHYLGLYESPIEAARAYDEAAREHFGAFARPNFPIS